MILANRLQARTRARQTAGPRSLRWLSNPIGFTAALACLMMIGVASPSRAQSTFQDGEGAVEFNSNAEPATPGVLPNKVNSSVDSAPTAAARKGQPRVGRRAAEKYMGRNPTHDGTTDSETSNRTRETRHTSSADAHYLAVHFGLYMSDLAYKWGPGDKVTHPGNYNIGVSYRLGEWVNSMDLNLRMDFSEYSLSGGVASKLAILPMITFPDVASRFPLYFGVGAGLGIFMHQLDSESSVAFEYQVIGGLRFFNVLPDTGFFIEGGVKNHVLLFTDGQFNGPFVALGSVFLF